jgi:hypothetical protein
MTASSQGHINPGIIESAWNVEVFVYGQSKDAGDNDEG